MKYGDASYESGCSCLRISQVSSRTILNLKTSSALINLFLTCLAIFLYDNKSDWDPLHLSGTKCLYRCMSHSYQNENSVKEGWRRRVE